MSWKDENPTQAIERAVKALGGPTGTANALGISSAGVHRWLNDGHVSTRANAIELCKAALAVGVGISPADLLGLPTVTDLEPAPLPTRGKKKTGSGVVPISCKHNRDLRTPPASLGNRAGNVRVRLVGDGVAVGQ